MQQVINYPENYILHVQVTMDRAQLEWSCRGGVVSINSHENYSQHVIMDRAQLQYLWKGVGT